jgi:hypothetical protein
MTGLQNIPAELIEAVCQQLDVLSIVRLTQVNGRKNFTLQCLISAA